MAANNNIFRGKCIHGKAGAKLIRGYLYNPKCDRCQQMYPELGGKK